MLLFKDSFVSPILRHEKIVTRRSRPEWKVRQFKPGAIHQAFVTPPWSDGKPFARLRIIGVTLSSFDAMWSDIEEAKREGFPSLAAFHEYVEEHHSGERSAPLARIEFALFGFDSRVAQQFIARAASRR